MTSVQDDGPVGGKDSGRGLKKKLCRIFMTVEFEFLVYGVFLGFWIRGTQAVESMFLENLM